MIEYNLTTNYRIMKKLILFFFALLFIAPSAFAGECHKITDVNDYWVEIKSGVNIRDEVCDGNVIGTLSAGTKVKVTGHIEDWRYIETPEGGVGFIWSDFVQNSSAPAEAETQEALYDIDGHKYEDAVRYLAENNIIQGYPDGSYKPENSVNRAEFTKIIVGAKLGSNPTHKAASCFPDVKASDWFASYVCYAKDEGIIGGYSDGSFKPGNNINLAEATKILVNTMAVEVSSDDGGQWYEVFIRSMQDQSYIPDSFSDVSQLVNRSQMAEMVHRIMEEISSKPAKIFVFEGDAKLPESEAGDLACIDDHVPSVIDMDALRNAWLSWHNKARSDRGIGALQMNEGLDYSSTLWAKSNKNDGQLTHDRPGNKSLTDWFAEVGIKFKNLNGVVYGENLGFRTYRCSKSDCTQEAIDSAKYIFDAFMAEEGTSYTGHYDNIVESDFVELGLGVDIDSEKEAMYITTQYSFGVESYPSNVCQ